VTVGPSIPNPAEGAAPAGFEGLQLADVQDLYDAVGRVVQKQTAALRRLADDAEGRLRLAQTESQRLARFLDEVQYRLRYQTEQQAVSEDLAAQEARLSARAADLAAAQSRLQQLIQRTGWFVRQLEASATRLDGTADGAAEEDPWAGLMREQLIQGQEAERARLAREIHDGPAQALTNTLLRLQFVESVLAARPDEAARELALLRTSVRDSLRDVRRFLFNLRPASLGEMSMSDTLGRLIQEYRDYTSLPIETNLPDTLDVGRDTELVVFRVVQEALQNIHKHAGASLVKVDATRVPEGWSISVTDDGRGFSNADGGAEVHSGLVGIRERAALVGGRLELHSHPGQGTRLTLTVPAGSPASIAH
jgi:two-component system sensor histidine kinase DegS